MLKHNKLILGLLAFAISISTINYNTTIKVNAEASNLEIYAWEKVKDLPVHESTDSSGITWGYQELSDGTLYLVYSKNTQAHMTVPAQLDGKTVSAIGDAVKYPEYKDYLTPRERMDNVLVSIKIPSTVKFIAPHSFNCANLTDVQLPETAWVDGSAFDGSPWLENQWDSRGLRIINGRLLKAKNQSGDITIPSNVKEIGDGAFNGQDNITGVTIQSNVIKIGENAFMGCNNLKNVKLPNSITEISSHAFGNCSSLENIIIPNSVTKIDEGAFSECSKLKDITIPSSVIEIGDDAFSECDSLKKVSIPNKNIHFGRDAFDDDVTVIKNGTSYAFKELNNQSSNTENNAASNSGNTTAQINKVQSGWHRNGEYWNWLWSDGSYRYGWYNENGNWYYFYGNGQMATEFIDLGGYSYYLKRNPSDGKAYMITGWQYIDGKWFYFNPNSDGYKGLMKRACWAYIDGEWYYFYYDGSMAHDTYIDGYYVNSNGSWVQ